MSNWTPRTEPIEHAARRSAVHLGVRKRVWDDSPEPIALIGRLPGVNYISPSTTITSPHFAGGLGGAQPHQFLMLPTS